MRAAVQIVVDDQRQHEPTMTATEALEHALRSGSLHKTFGTDPITRAYVAVMRHPRQARFDAKEIERREQDSTHRN